MTLLDVWNIIPNNENINWYVFNNNLKIVATYDGKNSIDTRFNNCVIESINLKMDEYIMKNAQ